MVCDLTGVTIGQEHADNQQLTRFAGVKVTIAQLDSYKSLTCHQLMY